MGKISRLSTGIPGFDKIVEGGVPGGSITLLAGSCGTGKSTFAMQFLYWGAKHCNEPGVYITLEEEPESLIQTMELFGWDIEGLIRQKKLMVIKPDVYKFDSIKQIISDAIDKIHAKRLVVDSYSVMLTYFKDPYEIRNGLVQLDREIKKMGCTALVISDINDDSVIFSTTGVEEFIVDGVIVLYLIKDRQNIHVYTMRAVSVRKMRATNHPINPFKFEITPMGIVITGAHKAKSFDSYISNSAPGEAARPERPRKRRAAGREKRHGGGKKPGGPSDAVAMRKDSMVRVGSLKKSGDHSWKWNYL